MQLSLVSAENGEWDKLWDEWSHQCAIYSETISDYATAALPVLEDLATDRQRPSAGVYGLYDPSGAVVALCQINSTYLPGYDGKVVRVRHITHCPETDLAGIDMDTFSARLAALFVRILQLTDEKMPARHVKFHFSSPAERQFFKEMEEAVRRDAADIVADIQLKGSWLYIKKAETIYE